MSQSKRIVETVVALRHLRLSQSQALRNTAFNFAGVIWRAGLSILLIPFYVTALAPQEWGLVAFCIALQGILALCEVGLGQLIPREIARAKASGGSNLSRTFGIFSAAYLGVGAVVAALGIVFAGWIETEWLQGTAAASSSHIEIRLAFVMFFFQFWNAVHLGFWNGTQEQKTVNVRQTLFATSKHATAALLVILWSPTAAAYLIGFTTLTVVEWSANRWSIRKQLANERALVRLTDVLALLKETAGLSVAIFAGMAVSQIDRFTLSSLVPLADYGRYIAVASLGLAFFQIQGPVLNAFLPRLATELPHGERRSLNLLALAIFVLNVLPCLSMAALAPSILRWWIPDAEVQSVGALPLQLIFLAVGVNSLYQIFYQQMVVFGSAKVIGTINVLNIIVGSTFMLYFGPRIGVAAGGWVWLLCATLQLAGGILWATTSQVTTDGIPGRTSIRGVYWRITFCFAAAGLIGALAIQANFWTALAAGLSVTDIAALAHSLHEIGTLETLLYIGRLDLLGLFVLYAPGYLVGSWMFAVVNLALLLIAAWLYEHLVLIGRDTKSSSFALVGICANVFLLLLMPGPNKELPLLVLSLAICWAFVTRPRYWILMGIAIAAAAASFRLGYGAILAAIVVTTALAEKLERSEAEVVVVLGGACALVVPLLWLGAEWLPLLRANIETAQRIGGQVFAAPDLSFLSIGQALLAWLKRCVLNVASLAVYPVVWQSTGAPYWVGVGYWVFGIFNLLAFGACAVTALARRAFPDRGPQIMAMLWLSAWLMLSVSLYVQPRYQMVLLPIGLATFAALPSKARVWLLTFTVLCVCVPMAIWSDRPFPVVEPDVFKADPYNWVPETR
ncbi:lipopolysaccharide biosynthesis protein [Allorhizobium sp. NPDC080224]|uniref:lipopolysaccharide biosynthesis protein n=1 Tax=Allorhizobium sp. NPDC080224 TaxID=3390547 RepID=UPI003D01FA6A